MSFGLLSTRVAIKIFSMMPDFQKVFECSPTPYMLLSPDLIIVGVNEAYAKATLINRSEVIGKHLFVVFPDNPNDDASSSTKLLSFSINTVVKRKKSHLMGITRYDIPVPGKSGEFEERFWQPRNNPVFNDAGDVVYILHDAEDVTDLVKSKNQAKDVEAKALETEVYANNMRLALEELKESRQKLEESEYRAKQILNSLPQIVWTATPDFHVDWYNDWWYKFLALPRGTKWDDPETAPMHPEDVEKTIPRLKEAVATGNDFHMEQRFRRGSDGEYRWHLVRGVPIKDGHGNIIKWIGGNTDIHDRKVAEERFLEEKEIRERFVEALSHDLRTPLTAAKMSSQLLMRSFGTDQGISKIAHRITDNMDRADRMIRDLLDASLLKAGEKLPLNINQCSLNEVVQGVVEDLSGIHGDRFILTSTEVIKGFWDCNGIQRVVENLATNATKYGYAGTPVTINLSKKNNTVKISVHNEGKTIPESELAKLFDPFRRSLSARTSEHQGWGIGLALVKGLSIAHGGDVEVKSKPGIGTAFIIKLPLDSRNVT